jgi:GDP-mannose 6-dehydrogenase
MLPGTMRNLILPLLEKHAGRPAGEGYEVLFHPEFLRESSAVWDFFNPPKIVVGELREGSSATLLGLYPQSIEAPRIVCPIEVAEMVKYCDNMFHAVKVTFANEVGIFCRSQGINSQEVMNIFCQDRKLNISDKYLKPGFAFGGSCLPKDLRAFLYASRAMELRTPFIAGILESNDEQISRVFNHLLRLHTRNVGFYGLSFKPGTDDLRESPLVTLAEHLLGKGITLRIYDDKVRMSQLIGGNRAYINERLPHLANQLVDTVEDLESCDVVILGHPMDEKSVRERFLDKGTKVVDLNPRKLPIRHAAYHNIAS